MQTRSERKSFRRLLLLAAGPKALSLPVILTCATISIVIHFAPSGSTVHGSIWIRILIAVVGYLPALGIVSLVYQLTKKIRRNVVRIALIFTSYLVGGALRGIFFSYVFYSLGMSNSPNLGFRILGSAIPFGLAMVLAAVSIGALSESRDRIRFLVAKQSELIAGIHELAKTREQFEGSIANEIEERLETGIRQLAGKPGESILVELRNLIGDFIRPLSHSLASEVSDWQPMPITEPKVKWRETLKMISPELALRPLLLSISAVITATPSFFFFFGSARAIVMLLIVFVSCFGLTMIFRSVAVRLANVPIGLKVILSSLFLLAIGGTSGYLSDLFSQDAANPKFAFDAGLLVIPVLGWLILIGGAANASARDLEFRLEEIVDQLGWLRARINLTRWFDSGEISRLLHSEIQSLVHAEIVRFETGASKERLDLALDSMRLKMHYSFKERKSYINLDSLIDELREFWSGVCDIQFAISNEARQALAKDLIGKSILWDIIKEACGNAIRHGKATKTQISIELGNPKQLQIQISNNGERPAEKLSRGLGTSILDACAISWWLRPDREKVVLTALLPIEASI